MLNLYNFSFNQITRSHPQAARVTQKPTNCSKNVLLREPSFSGNSAGPRAQRGTTGASKSNQDNVGDDKKLVEMINNVIVDRSPSVKWDDIGETFLVSFVFLYDSSCPLKLHLGVICSWS